MTGEQVTPQFQVFVYGTLKPGECNYQRYCVGRVIKTYPAITFGQLFALPMGYPGMTTGERIIYGVVLGFNDPTLLLDLDQLEGYHAERPELSEYERQLINIFDLEQKPLGAVWAYLMRPEKNSTIRRKINSGRVLGVLRMRIIYLFFVRNSVSYSIMPVSKPLK